MLKSTRLILKAPILADAPDIAKYLNRKDTANMMASIALPFSLDDAKNIIGLINQQAVDKMVNAIYNLQGQFMGVVGIMVQDDIPSIGYWLGNPFWGNGYMTEAAKLSINSYFQTTQYNEIHTTHFLTNPQSQSIIQKLGFTYQGNKMIDIKVRNSSEECRHYILTRQDWQQNHA